MEQKMDWQSPGSRGKGINKTAGGATVASKAGGSDRERGRPGAHGMKIKDKTSWKQGVEERPRIQRGEEKGKERRQQGTQRVSARSWVEGTAGGSFMVEWPLSCRHQEGILSYTLLHFMLYLFDSDLLLLKIAHEDRSQTWCPPWGLWI